MERLARIGIMRFEELLERWEGATLEPRRGGRGFRGKRADLPPLAPAVRRGRGGRPGRSPGRPADRPGGRPRMSSSACARCISSTTRVSPSSTSTRSSRSGTATSSATPQPGSTSKRPGRCGRRRGAARTPQATASSIARNDVAPGRLAARVAGGRPPLDLVVTMDDATSEIYSASWSRKKYDSPVLRAVGSICASRPAAGACIPIAAVITFSHGRSRWQGGPQPADQVGRALAHLGIEHIAAYSPQARGRSERLFQTLQDRVPKELVLAGITTVEAANACLANRYTGAQRAVRDQGRAGGPRLRRGARVGSGPRSCAFRKTAWSATTTAYHSSIASYRYRRARCVRTSSRRR